MSGPAHVDADSTPEPDEPTPELLTAPADGWTMVADVAGLAAMTDALVAGDGPLGIDTERAQSYRYSAKAYLIQLRRRGAGTFLLDPVALEGDRPRADLSGLASALGDVEWVLHAATQDLPCLAQVGMVPRTLFDTELGGRLLGLPKVSLGALAERALGKALLKEHSAADWSKRPLPDEWLTYAALDVELLADLREWMASELESAGKLVWAQQEFAHLAAHASDPPAPRDDPWRRTSGLHALRKPTTLAVVRELWLTRDEVARELDRAPSRVLGDAAIVELASQLNPPTVPRLGREQLRSVRGFSWRLAARHETRWLQALERAASLTKDELPPTKRPAHGPPPPRSWEGRFPDAWARWNRVRPATIDLAEQLSLPVENLAPPEAIRLLCWTPPASIDEASVRARLAELGVRPWQQDRVAPVVTPLLQPADGE